MQSADVIVAGGTPVPVYVSAGSNVAPVASLKKAIAGVRAAFPDMTFTVDLLVVEYAGGDKLYLPVYRLNQIQKYSGGEGAPRLDKLGGNGPIMANALASFGIGVTYLGSLGYPALHPVFDTFAQRAKVSSLCGPGLTDCVSECVDVTISAAHCGASEADHEEAGEDQGPAQDEKTIAQGRLKNAMDHGRVLPMGCVCRAASESGPGRRSGVRPT